MEESFKTSKYRVDTLVQLAKARSWGGGGAADSSQCCRRVFQHNVNLQKLSIVLTRAPVVLSETPVTHIFLWRLACESTCPPLSFSILVYCSGFRISGSRA